MNSNQQQLVDQDCYPAALVLPQSKMILAEDHGQVISLPRISIPRWTRRAEKLSEACYRKWQVRSIVVDFLETGSQAPPCVVIEVLTPDWDPSAHGFQPVQIDEVDERELTESERAALHSILEGDPLNRGPFSRLGWIEEAQAWLRQSVPDRNIEFTDDIRQLAAGSTFALLRFGMRSGPALWMKAVGEANRAEFEITMKLFQLFPDHLPRLVQSRSDWCAWILEDAGQSFWETPTPHRFELAVTSLAQLQIAALGSAKELMEAGLSDQRIERLEEHLDGLFDYFRLAMRAQTSTKVSPLDLAQLHEIETTVRDVCAKMRQLSIPVTLVHNDLNPGNILSDGNRCVFTDWSEGGVGNPLITLEYLLEHAAKEHSAQFVDHLRLLYRRYWSDLVTDEQFGEAMCLTPILAAVSCLAGSKTFLQSERRRDPVVQSHARGLARYIGRLTQGKELRSTICH